MRTDTYRAGRLIKVLLPGHLVDAMDDEINGPKGYTSRAEFIADAIDGHLTELRLQQTGDGAAPPDPTEQHAPPVPAKSRAVIAAIPALSQPPTILEYVQTRSTEPTWGMHNRDFPTLWALAHLCRTVTSVDGPVPFGGWIAEVVADAWDLGRRLPSDKFDVSGFPTNPTKRDASEGRFVRFFIGDSPGVGPLFELALAGADSEGRVAPAAPGFALLGELEGFSCERGRGIPERWTAAFLRHLATHAPADLAFMAEILTHIERGHDNRLGLVGAMADLHPGWSDSVVDTNVAGFIARAREWGLLLPRQRKGRYILEDGAMGLLKNATGDDVDD